jgi:hypothetical protein
VTRPTRSAALLYVFFSIACFASTENQPPVSNPEAVTLAARSIAALTGGAPIRDVTLTGNVTWGGGDSETGTFTLKALGNSESRMDLALASGTRTEIRDAQTGIPSGKWIAPTGKSGHFGFHNCSTDPVWFFPALGSLSFGPNVVLSYIGQETRNGGTVQHIQSYAYQPDWPSLPGPTLQQLSTMDIYLDATSFLPVAVTFNAHPDNTPATNLLVEVDFSDYQIIGGVRVPMHIQKYHQGNLMIDLVVSGAMFNTGLPISTFTINWQLVHGETP